MSDAQSLLDSYSEAAKPIAGQVTQPVLQPQATAPPPVQAAQPAAMAPPQASPVAPINVPNVSPAVSNFEANMGQTMTTPTIPKYELNVHVPEAPKEQPSLWDKMIAPVGSFAQGLGGGVLHDMDTAGAAMEAPFRLGAQVAHIPQAPAPGME